MKLRLLSLLLLSLNLNIAFAQSGFTLLDTCRENDDGYISYSRNCLITTDSGSYELYQQRDVHDSVWTTNGFVLISLSNEIKTTDSSGRLTEKLLSTRDSTTWKNSKRTLFTYDSFGRLTDSIVQVDSSGAWINYFLWHRQLDSTGNILLNETKSWINGQWINNNKTEWSFNSSGVDTLKITYTGDTLTWIPLIKLRKLFNPYGLIDSLTYQWNGASWNNQNRTQYFYKALSEDTLDIYYLGNVFQWDTNYVIHNTFDSLGNKIISQRLNYINMLWGNYSQIFYVYDSLNRVVLETDQSGHDSVWVNSTQTITEYSSPNIVNTTTQNWVDTVWQCSYYNSIDQYSPFEYHQVSGYYSADCSGYDIFYDVTIGIDSAGREVYSDWDGHMGSSRGTISRAYDDDGFLYEEHQSSSTMGGITRDFDCYHYKPLLFSFDNSIFNSCAGDTIHFAAYPSGGAPGYRYEWKFNNTILSDSTSTPSFVAQNRNGIYTLTVTDSLGNYFSDNIYVTLHPSVSLGNDTILCVDTSLVLSPGVYSSYMWNDGSSNSTLIASSAGHVADTLSFWVQVSDSMGCINTDSITISFDACLSISEIQKSTFNIFPNPALNGQEIKIISDEIPESILVESVSGQILFENKNQNELKLNRVLQPGIYFIVFKFDSAILTKRLIVF